MTDNSERDARYPARTDADFPPDEWTQPDDEISLYDLWITLFRRKWLIVGVTAACVAAGLAYWVSQPVTERFQTALEVGSIIEGEELSEIEPRSAVITRLRETALPTIRHELAAERELSSREIPEVTFRSPGEDEPGAFVFLESEVDAAKEPLVSELHQRLVDFTREVHQSAAAPAVESFESRLASLEVDLQAMESGQSIAVRRAELATGIEEADDEIAAARDTAEVDRRWLNREIQERRARLRSLEGERGRLTAKIDRLETERELLASQLEEAREWLDESLANQRNLGQGTGSTEGALGAFLVGDVTGTARQEVARLERELQLGVPERREELEGQLDENAEWSERIAQEISEREAQLEQLEGDLPRRVAALEGEKRRLEAEKEQLVADLDREIDRKRQEIRHLRSQGDRMQPTRSLSLAVSAGPEGRGGALILALSLVLGGMLGVFSAFALEFHRNAMRRMRGGE